MTRWLLRIFLLATVAAAGVGAFLSPIHRPRLVAAALGVLLALGLSELFALGLERFVGLRYLHRARRARSTMVGMALALGLAGLGLGLFFVARGHSRSWETVGVVMVLLAGLGAVSALLLRLFSVFTTVSTMGVVLGVASLIVVLAVTSGFEREFQDKVLALNAHLIVIPYGNVDIESPEADRIQEKLRGMPGVVRMAKFLFSAGEVMVGRVGANLKGIDLEQGADDLRRALIEGSVEDLGRPASCTLPPGTPARAATGVGRIVLGAELAHRLRVKVGSCLSILVPFSSVEGSAPPSFL
jgi:hypothetical protein